MRPYPAAFNPIGCLCFLTTSAKASSDSPNPLPDSWLRRREVLS
jgi:hypothetical protein